MRAPLSPTAIPSTPSSERDTASSGPGAVACRAKCASRVGAQPDRAARIDLATTFAPAALGQDAVEGAGATATGAGRPRRPRQPTSRPSSPRRPRRTSAPRRARRLPLEAWRSARRDEARWPPRRASVVRRSRISVGLRRRRSWSSRSGPLAGSRWCRRAGPSRWRRRRSYARRLRRSRRSIHRGAGTQGHRTPVRGILRAARPEYLVEGLRETCRAPRPQRPSDSEAHPPSPGAGDEELLQAGRAGRSEG